MPLKVTFELDDKDLKFFRSAMKQAKETAGQVSEQQILQRAEAMVSEVRAQQVPAFVQQRLERLAAMIDMAKDEEWALASQERKNVLAALAYFADPHDMIPDNIPVLGYIDDAIMIELVVSELKHEIEAFEDFCRYRAGEKSRSRSDLSREDYLAIKRRELHSRMRRRRGSIGSRAGGRTRIRLF